MPEVAGNVKGLKNGIIDELGKLYEQPISEGNFADRALLDKLAALTGKINREIAVYVNRRGKVESVSVGDFATVELPPVDKRRAANRLSGVTCIHTHPSADSALSELDIASLKKNRYDMMIAVGVCACAFSDFSIGVIAGIGEGGEYLHETFGPFAAADVFDFTQAVKQAEKAISGAGADKNTDKSEEIAYIAGIDRPDADLPADESLAELARLVESAGAAVAGSVTQKRGKADAGWYLGSGRIMEMAMACQEKAATMAVFDDELSPAQQRNIEEALGIKVIDRAALILDIFAQRANTYEGKLQVELAQLKYTLPRLAGQGLVLSRTGGGIGTRGPGETKLETDRRHVRNRIAEIEKSLIKVKNVRQLHIKNRVAGGQRLVALIGYTNAGKSTLLNALTNAGAYVEDKLFATLDTATRRLSLPSGREALLTDTVGFIRKLPHQLVAAFRATLEEVVQADLLLHVVDAANPFYREQSDAVYKVLEELGAHGKKIITVFNKADKLTDGNVSARLAREEASVAVSAVNGDGLAELSCLIDKTLENFAVEAEFLVPYDQSAVAAHLHECAQVLAKKYTVGGVLLKVSGAPEILDAFIEYRR
ncbi:MAG: GTPase HflX [Acidaminococcales bacterium]|jgi:GTP-binding protein HflX|nr:GTPase HflX [Acidaminococcales bacterium]